MRLIPGARSPGTTAIKKLWACSSYSEVGLIDLATDVFTPAFTSQGCFDGLAYDATDNTLWSSADATPSIQHYDTTGALLSSTAVNLGGNGNSGIAVGGSLLYLANNGGQQIYSSAKDLASPTLFASFPARIEDLECDNVTFAGSGKGAIWSIDAYDNNLNAYEIPAGSCTFGGGGGGGGGTNNPPDCSAAMLSEATLWPANHNMRRVSVNGVTDPDGDPITITVTAVRQDEPTMSTFSGDRAPDARDLGGSSVVLRAERFPNGDGRVYHVTFTASDGTGLLHGDADPEGAGEEPEGAGGRRRAALRLDRLSHAVQHAGRAGAGTSPHRPCLRA